MILSVSDRTAEAATNSDGHQAACSVSDGHGAPTLHSCIFLKTGEMFVHARGGRLWFHSS